MLSFVSPRVWGFPIRVDSFPSRGWIPTAPHMVSSGAGDHAPYLHPSHPHLHLNFERPGCVGTLWGYGSPRANPMAPVYKQPQFISNPWGETLGPHFEATGCLSIWEGLRRGEFALHLPLCASACLHDFVNLYR